MSFKRIIRPTEFATGEQLTRDLVAIGFRLAEHASKLEPNIEDTVVAASIEGVVREDYRVLALLVDWLEIHLERVNVDRLTRVVATIPEKSVKIFWAAIADWRASDTRLAKLRRLVGRQRWDLLGDRTEFLVDRDDEDDRFMGTLLRLPGKFLRKRPTDILLPADLAKRHKAYYWRILIGPSYRADMWSALERDSSLSPSDLARLAYGSFPTAWAVKKDWLLLLNSRVKAKLAS